MASLRGKWRSAVRRASRALVYRVPGEQDRCPTCASPRLRELDLLALRDVAGGPRTGFVSVCEDCGLVFRNPQPTPEALKRFYSPAGEWGAPRGGAIERHDGDDARSRFWSKLFDPIRADLSVTTPPAGARVLDFGCGSGKLLDSLQECGWETWGIETAVDDAFSRHRRLDEVPRTPEFDLIVASHVLEHLADPLGLLRQLSRACRIGGFLYVGVPRFDTLPVHRDYKYVINSRAHVTAFTWPCLQGLLARTGWRPVAPPPDWISQGRGRRTCARLRVNAQRTEAHVEPLPLPAEAARDAVRRYHASTGGRPLLERLGFFRLAARRAESRRGRRPRGRKSSRVARRMPT